ncbi:hypothetical protein [Tepidiphilus thermophilus]|uniref:hypothetical protein n=1 Tax=Tepidiphilus thermophilus TaxID=876478 RepID=UPI0012F77DCF|nr:hypothetical protein [Tepidiphilus thermophilus]
MGALLLAQEGWRVRLATYGSNRHQQGDDSQWYFCWYLAKSTGKRNQKSICWDCR